MCYYFCIGEVSLIQQKQGYNFFLENSIITIHFSIVLAYFNEYNYFTVQFKSTAISFKTVVNLDSKIRDLSHVVLVVTLKKCINKGNNNKKIVQGLLYVYLLI